MLSDLRHPHIWSGVGWVAVIAALTLSLMPDPLLQADSLNDKFVHALGYAMLTTWFCGIYPRSRYWVIAAGFLVMGVATEVLQGALHWGRQADLHDLYADGAGIALGVLLACATPLGRWAQRVETLLVRGQAASG